MAEYIEREALLKAMSYHNYYPKGKHFLKGIETAEEIIEHFPAADVQTVTHGEWKLKDNLLLSYSCSVCGVPQWNISMFCPNCGAVMDGEAWQN